MSIYGLLSDMPKRRDQLTPDLFAVPAPVEQLPGSLDFGLAVRRMVSNAIKASPHTAAQIAAHMSELTGQTITEHMIHSWSAPSREGWRFPLEYLPAFEVACETHAISGWIAATRGGRLLIGRDALNADLGRLERMRDEVSRDIRDMKKFLGETE